MTLLLAPALLSDRRRIAAETGGLAPLAASLAGELRRVIHDTPELPTAKAQLSRDGGRCATDGAMLDFDPWSPHRHRCPVCGRAYEGERHHRWWIMSQQLWLAERAVIAATLRLLTGDDAAGRLASALLQRAAEQYLSYPNRDNVLGPSRPFFSTYLESIWLLQLCIALDLLEMDGSAGDLRQRVRERIIEPSVALIASFDEGGSNRQVWNAVAMLAAGVLLDRADLRDRAVHGPSGLHRQIARGLLPDGTWYEGENYHLFTHRGLWYGLTMCELNGFPLPAALGARYREGFTTPLLTALPDLTFPSRRDSQYAVSLRQWRIAESLELGLARGFDARLAAGLRELYATEVERRDTDRWRSTAEAERNAPPSRLDRSDLGWKSLLHAREHLPELRRRPQEAVLLEHQGLVVLRPEQHVYVALDYGEPGGGHGHPDRLNVILAVEHDRWLDDPGTGSYVDPTLFWYRSTLAHNAPLVNGRSQRPAKGVLGAFDLMKRQAFVEAELPEEATGGVRFTRTLVTTPDYLLDVLTWRAANAQAVDLPVHVPFEAARELPWQPGSVEGGSDPADGFPFLRDVQLAPADSSAVLLHLMGERADPAAALLPMLEDSRQAIWWRARHPGPPGRPEGAVLALRSGAPAGSLAALWSWHGGVCSLERDGDRILVRLDGQRRADVHERREGGWSITRPRTLGYSRVELRGARPALVPTPPGEPRRTPRRAPLALHRSRPLAAQLGEESWRRSEESWEEAGRPSATVELRAIGDRFIVDTTVRKRHPLFRAVDDDPALDNEHPDIHSDGLQLHLLPADAPEAVSWLIVPDAPPPRVRMNRRGPASISDPEVSWEPTTEGYRVRCTLVLRDIAGASNEPFALDVIVNEIGQGRQRRRGQLVLSGGGGEWIYLRGDRQPVERYLPVRVVND